MTNLTSRRAASNWQNGAKKRGSLAKHLPIVAFFLLLVAAYAAYEGMQFGTTGLAIFDLPEESIQAAVPLEPAPEQPPAVGPVLPELPVEVQPEPQQPEQPAPAAAQDVVIEPESAVIEKIVVKGWQQPQSFGAAAVPDIRIDENISAKPAIRGRLVNKVFAIDPTAIEFSSIEVAYTPQGTELWKCTSWDFAAQECTDGNWQLFLSGLTPGEPIVFTLTAGDPGFGDASPDEGTPDDGGAEAFGGGFDSTAGTFNATQANDGTLFSIRQTNGGGANIDLQAFMNLTYNLTPLFSAGVTSAKINNLTFRKEFCVVVDNADPITCDGTGLAAASTPRNPLSIELYNWTAGGWRNVSTYNITGHTSSAERNNTFVVLGGFSSFVNSTTGFIRVRYKVDINISANGDDASYGIDFAPLTVAYDNTPPSVVAVSPTGGTFSQNTAVNVSANVTDAISAVDKVFANVTLPNSTVRQLELIASGGNIFNRTFSETSLAGLYNITFIANDTKGNTNDTVRTNFTIVAPDTTPPAVAFVAPTPASGTVTNASQIVNVTASDAALDSIIIFVNGTALATCIASPCQLNLTADGNYTYFAAANDTAGNVNTTENRTLLIDKVAPQVAFIAPTPANNTVADQSQTINVTASDARLDRIRIVVNGTTAATCSSSPCNLTIFAEGNYSYFAIANDTVGNSNATETRVLAILFADTAPPSVTLQAPAAGSNFTINSTVEVKATVTDSSTVDKVFANITLPNSTVRTAQLLGSGTYSANFTELALKGRYNITFIANDTSGNVNATTATFFNRIALDPANQLDLTSSNSTLLGANITVLNNASGILTISVIPANQTVQRIIVSGYNENSPKNLLRIENRTNDTQFRQTYLVDASQLNATSLNVTVTALAESVYICTEFNSSSQSCAGGGWEELLLNAVPGQNYTFTLNVSDPGFGESSPDEGTPDAGNYVAFDEGFSSTVNTFASTQANDNAYFAVRRSNGGGANADLEAYLNLSYNLTNLTAQGLTAGKILNFTFRLEHCFNDDITGGFACGSTGTGGTVENPLGIELFNWTSNSYVRVGEYNGSQLGEGNATQVVLSGFADFLNSTTGFVNIRYAVNVTIALNGNDSAFGADFAPLTVSFDILRPQVTNATAVPGGINQTQSTNITASVVDVNGTVDTVRANITSPNGTIIQQAMSVVSGSLYSTVFTPSLSDAPGIWNVTIIANDTRNNVNDTERTSFNVSDVTRPSVTAVSPLGTSFPASTIVNVSANVTDNIGVSAVTANITLPNSTVRQVQLVLSGGFIFNSTFAETSVAGLYNITFIANDTSGNANNTVRTNFTIIAADTAPPVVVLQRPANGTALNITAGIAFNISATDNVALNNITLYANFTGSFAANETRSVSGASASESFSRNLSDGIYIWNGQACDSSGNCNFSASNFTVIIDTIAPAVQFVSPTPANATIANSSQTINVTASDARLDTIRIIVNGTAVQACAAAQCNFTITAEGVYSYFAIANDTAGNVAQTEIRNLTIDRTTPAVAFAAPTPASAAIANSSQVINVTASDTTGIGTIRIFVNGTVFATCASSPCNLTISAEGNYSYFAIANDTAGNVNTTETRTLLIDQTAPAVAFVSPTPPTGTKTDSAKLINVTASDIRFDRIRIVVNGTTLATCTSPCALNLTADGNYTYFAIANDTAGNVNTTETRTLVIDSIRPEILFVAPTPANATVLNVSDFFINVTISEPADSAVLEFNGTNETMTSSNSTSWFKAKSSLANGQYSYKVYANDTAGNTNVSQTRTVIVNVTVDIAPPTVTLNSPANGTALNISAVVFNVSATDNFGLSNITLFANFTGSFIANQTQSASGLSASVLFNKTLADGVYLWNGQACDTSANCSFASSNFTVIVDTSAPAVAFASPTPANGTITNLTQTINVTASDARLDRIRIVVNGTTQNTCSSSPCNLTMSADGNYTYFAIANDTAGNLAVTETRTLVIDKAAPAVAFVSPTPASAAIANSSQTINVTSFDANPDRLRIFVNSSAAVTCTSSPCQLNITADGSYVYFATANDTAGNANSTESRSLIIDRAAPAVSFASPTPANATIANVSQAINVSASDTNLDTIRLFVNGSLAATCSSSPCNITLADGVYSYFAIANDTAGNVNTTEVRNLTIDRVAPSVAFVAPTPANATLASTAQNINVTASDARLDTIRLVVNGTTLQNCNSSPCNVTLSDGVYSYFAIANDTAGNINRTETRTLTIDTIPPQVAFAAPTPANGTTTTAIQTINVTASDANLDRIRVVVNNSALATCQTSPCNVTLGIGEYRYNATANDTAGNSNVTETRFLNITPDLTPPSIFNIRNGTVTNVTAIILWDTDDFSNSTVLFSANASNLNSTAIDTSLVQNHSVSLAGLAPNTTYFYNVSSCNSAGFCNSSGLFNFTTAAAFVPPVCGNGIVESGESCDDGNTASGDGCSSVCATEPPPPSAGPPAGAGGGGAPAPPGPVANYTIRTEFHRADIAIAYMAAGVVYRLDISGASTPVTELGIVLAQPARNASLSLVKTELQLYQASAREFVYDPIEIIRQGVDVREIVMKFVVPLSWYEQTGTDPATTIVKRQLQDGSWVDVETLLLQRLADRYEFIAVSPSTSFFTIVATAPVARCDCVSGDWTSCIAGEQTRLVSICGPETGYRCEPAIERRACEAPLIQPLPGAPFFTFPVGAPGVPGAPIYIGLAFIVIGIIAILYHKRSAVFRRRLREKRERGFKPPHFKRPSFKPPPSRYKPPKPAPKPPGAAPAKAVKTDYSVKRGYHRADVDVRFMNRAAYHKVDVSGIVAPLKEVGVVLSNDASGASLSVVKMERTRYEPKEREQVYEPFQITQEGLDVKALTVKFSVPESWYEGTGTDPSTTVLKTMGRDGAWHSLRTSLMHKVVDRYEFVAIAPAPSLFAIVASVPAQLYRTQHHYK